MKQKLIEHCLSILLVAALFFAIILWLQGHDPARRPAPVPAIEEFTVLDFIDFGDPLDRALFKESVDVVHPDDLPPGDSLLRAIDDLRREQFANELYKAGREPRGLTGSKLGRLSLMYVQFIVVYLIVIAITYYGAQTIGITRFVAMKAGTTSFVALLLTHLKTMAAGGPRGGKAVARAVILLAKACGKGGAYLILFAPAYVIAYSFKTEFDTGSHVFMVLLGLISNGLLINYANKFFTLLVSESRKGYVDTAIVKNLNNSYTWDLPDGIRWKSLFPLKKEFPSHVFQHIYLNARYQFIPTLKEHASFLITGLVIIEMALNIQGHLCYEMLKNILYKQYDVVLSIVLALFFLVKSTEIVVDIWAERESRNYENRGER